MHSQFANDQLIQLKQTQLNARASFVGNDSFVTQVPNLNCEFTQFQSHFQDCMEMYAEAEEVAAYLDAHQEWFRRCAYPMEVEPIRENGYALVIGRFGNFGYELEPKIGLELLPQKNGIYRIQTIPIPNYVPQSYDVDFQASQTFVEVPTKEYFQGQNYDDKRLPPAITRVEWTLKLNISLCFPKFIQKLPQSLVQTTGDRLLCQIVRKISRRLTYKVQQDFHCSRGLPLPKKSKRLPILHRSENRE
ncbi:MAG: DUF1997 domain-containing protein [Symploca sp. SIO2C1]|nr:DUF1997 domain-containing protein [Symploca sp. SIO2C1]